MTTADQLEQQDKKLDKVITTLAVIQRDMGTCLKVVEGNGRPAIDTRVALLEATDQRASRWAWRLGATVLALGTGWILNIVGG